MSKPDICKNYTKRHHGELPEDLITTLEAQRPEAGQPLFEFGQLALEILPPGLTGRPHEL